MRAYLFRFASDELVWHFAWSHPSDAVLHAKVDSEPGPLQTKGSGILKFKTSPGMSYPPKGIVLPTLGG